ncbi:MAG: ArsA family ATPase [Oligoflexia bacterium]|nr:ArsA family ATPase [Oligoflexia bacterium]
MSLLDHSIIVVTGKGGVGKTTVCAVLGLIATRQGKRAIITETSGARVLPGIFGVKSQGYQPVELSPGLDTLSITPLEAIEDYVVQQIKVRKLYELVFRNRVMAPFVDGVPGLHDAVQLGKVWDCAVQARDWQGHPRWDLVIVDAPATGHGLTMLQAPRSMMDLTRAGPLYKGNAKVESVLSDPVQTRLIIVCLPEEMPVAETIELSQRLGPRRRQLSLCVLNEMHPAPSVPPQDWTIARDALTGSSSPALDEAVGLVDTWQDRMQAQDRARKRLAAELKLTITDLPFLFRRRLTPADLARLADTLTPVLTAV